jgi:hypothetical protein
MTLADHQPGTLAREQWEYLHQRTGGRIHSLTRLLGEATAVAITEQSERVDKDLLDRIVIDEAAEQQRPRPASSKRRAA